MMTTGLFKGHTHLNEVEFPTILTFIFLDKNEPKIKTDESPSISFPHAFASLSTDCTIAPAAPGHPSGQPAFAAHAGSEALFRYTDLHCGTFKTTSNEPEQEAPTIPAPEELSISVYPNPNSGSFELSPDGNFGFPVSITAVNLYRQEVLHLRSVNGPPVHIDLNHVTKGIYHLKVQAGKRSWLKKVVLQ